DGIRDFHVTGVQTCALPIFWALPLILCCAISRMVSTDSCLAVSINEHVLTTMTSASSAREVICAPPRCSMPIITSLSTRFFGHPRLTNPTFRGLDSGGCSGTRVMVGLSTGMSLSIVTDFEVEGAGEGYAAMRRESSIK